MRGVIAVFPVVFSLRTISRRFLPFVNEKQTRKDKPFPIHLFFRLVLLVFVVSAPFARLSISTGAGQPGAAVFHVKFNSRI